MSVATVVGLAELAELGVVLSDETSEAAEAAEAAVLASDGDCSAGIVYTVEIRGSIR